MPDPTAPATESDVLTKCEVVRPTVSFRMYWPEITLLFLAYATPFVGWAVWQSGPMLERSASVMLFFAALAEFLTLNRMNRKHLLNACRAKDHQRPWDFSGAARCVGALALLAGLIGTVLWGYGSLLF